MFFLKVKLNEAFSGPCFLTGAMACYECKGERKTKNNTKKYLDGFVK